jgi:hypothetical protein
MTDTRIFSEEEIDLIFEEGKHQTEMALALYRLVYPDWDNIESIDGWPKAGKEVSAYLMKKFIAFDRKHHHGSVKGEVRDRGCMPGGLWLNKGFSTLDAEHLYPWEVERAPVVYKVVT